MSSQAGLELQKVSVSNKVRAGRIPWVWLTLAVVLSCLQWYTSRYNLGVDAIGYIDTALAYLRRDWHTAINSYWSPLYSWILTPFLAIFPTNARTELPLVHFVNLPIFFFVFWSFHRFWRVLPDPGEGLTTVARLCPRLFQAFGYSIFLYLFVPLVSALLADTLAAAIIFLIATEMVIWKRTGQRSLAQALLLGLLIALGFYAKAILLYFGLISLACAVLDSSLQRRVRTVAIALIVSLVLILPWAAAMKWSTGNWSLGSSGRLTYSWFVDGAATGSGFQQPGGPSTAFFPGPRLQPGFDAFAVPTLDHVTYLPWYDPWRLDHSKAVFRLRGEIAAVKANLKWLRGFYLIEFGAIVLILATLAILAGRNWGRSIVAYHAILLPCLALIGMYSLIFIRSYRYLIALSLVIFGVLLVAPVLDTGARRYVRPILIAGLSLFWISNVPGTLAGILQRSPEFQNNVVAAEALNQRSEPHAKVGVIGTGSIAYWAHLARTSVAAEVWDSAVPVFWTAPCEFRQQVLSEMSAVGVQAAVGKAPASLRSEGWQPLSTSGFSILPLQSSPPLHCQK